MTDKPDNQFRSAIVLLVIAIAFISGVVVGGVLTAYEVTRSIEAMGNLFDKVQIGNVTIDLNETEITQTAINYIEREKTWMNTNLMKKEILFFQSPNQKNSINIF